MGTGIHRKVLMINWIVLGSFAAPVLAAPVGDVIVSGSGSISRNGAITDIQQNSNNLVINWQSFNIQAGEQVNFIQPQSSSIALNRDFSGVPSEIFGNLNANGQVFLLNTAGILIGSGASVNVAGLFLSDMSVSDDEFDRFSQTGEMILTDSNTQQGGIRIEGAVTTSTRSGITLISQFIDNSGSLTANDGNINLAVAGGPIVVTDAAGSIGVQISQGVVQDLSSDAVLLDNAGDIRAINGNILINMQYLSSLNVQAVRNTGLINAIGIGYGEINQNIVLQAPQAVVDDGLQTDEIVSESLGNNNLPDERDDALAERPTDNLSALDNLIEDCEADSLQDKECEKKRAIKRYLGRLLIGGSLPE
jgi:filamentous hemagglutinin family protein